jgi:hypothetical protein
MDTREFASVSFVQSGNNLLHRPGHNVEISLPTTLNVVAASKRDHIAVPVGAFSPGRGLYSPYGYHLIGLPDFRGFFTHLYPL